MRRADDLLKFRFLWSSSTYISITFILLSTVQGGPKSKRLTEQSNGLNSASEARFL